MECPTGLDATLSLANRNPFADALEVLQGNATTAAFGFRVFKSRLTDSVRFMAL